MASGSLDRTVLVVAGPTASGKSALALAAAREFNGVIINADSMQLYDALPILTAQPTQADRQAAPHALYGVLPAETVGTAQDWRAMALREIAAGHAAGRLPIVVGGTGLYLRTLMAGLAPMPDVPPDIRARVRQMWDEKGPAAVRARLEQVDPEIASRLKPGDRQRQLRALEVFEATGRPLSHWQQQTAEGPPAGLRFARILLQPDRSVLRTGIAARFGKMLETGALAEVEALLARGLSADRPILRAVGLPQLAAVLRGEIDLDQAVSQAVIATGQYAKRQDTWFRHQFVADLTIESQFSEKYLPQIFSFIRRFGLTVPD